MPGFTGLPSAPTKPTSMPRRDSSASRPATTKRAGQERSYSMRCAEPVTTHGPHPETSDLVAGWWMIDVDSHERALELAAYVSSEPGPGGEPLYEWIDVREVMWERPRTPDPA